MVRNIFVRTFLITVGIFVIGFFAGSMIERSLTGDLETKTTEVENSIQEIELESLLVTASGSERSCVFLNDIVRRTNNNLDELAGQVATYDEDLIIFTNKDLVNLKEKYTNLLLKSWLLQGNIEKNCGTSAVSILYFYDRECSDCLVQGNILTSLKNDFKESVMIFPLDHSLGMSTVGLLESSYNVTKYPSLVINERRFGGIIGSDDLRDYVCSVIPENGNCAQPM